MTPREIDALFALMRDVREMVVRLDERTVDLPATIKALHAADTANREGVERNDTRWAQVRGAAKLVALGSALLTLIGVLAAGAAVALGHGA